MESSKKIRYEFTLYISGMNTRSMEAIENLKTVFEEYLQYNYNFTIIDVSKYPKRRIMNEIVALPTLIRNYPLPEKKLVGNFNDIEKVRSLF